MLHGRHPCTEAMRRPFTLTFPGGEIASRIRVGHPGELPVALDRIGLAESRPTLALVGGAQALAASDMARLRSLFIEVLAPVAEQLGLYVVDGGTDAGIMSLIGEARAATRSTFPLIGVAATGTVALPMQAVSPADAELLALLEPHHTHFVLVPGSSWGDEALWLAQVASTLADKLPSLTVLMNGGEITWLDARCSIQAGRPILVLEGTGRAADALAKGTRGEHTDTRARDLVATGLVHVVNIEAGPVAIAEALKKYLAVKGDRNGAEAVV
jgi:hypothetical protein